LTSKTVQKWQHDDQPHGTDRVCTMLHANAKQNGYYPRLQKKKTGLPESIQLSLTLSLSPSVIKKFS
jgi:hypothetical protein